MNSFSELIAVRRSHRKFTDEPVSEEDLKCILRAGLMAPSSKGLHSSEFIVVKEPRTLARLSQCKAVGSDFLIGAPLVIAVAANPEVSDVWIEDASVAATMMLLQAEDLGLGACWVQSRERKDAEGRSTEENVCHLLGVPEGKRVVAIVAVGHKGMERKPQNEERLKWAQVHQETWS